MQKPAYHSVQQNPNWLQTRRSNVDSLLRVFHHNVQIYFVALNVLMKITFLATEVFPKNKEC